MPYNLPKNVISPQASVSNVKPIYDGGENHWSAALILWDGEPALGIRWNGGSEPGRKNPHPGQPNSRGLSTWFVLPDEITASVLVALKGNGLRGESINKEQATRWVDKELQDRQVEPTTVQNDDFARRVSEIVVRMKEAGEL